MPPQLFPPSVEKYPRIGSRKISFDPPARLRGLAVLSVMYVSLCGPHSLETSTLLPTVTDAVLPLAGSEPLFFRYWYLSHQVGSLELFVCANAADANRHMMRDSLRIRRLLSGFERRKAYHGRRMPACATSACSSPITLPITGPAATRHFTASASR